MRYLGIGWDAGGWQGNKQAVAVVSWMTGAASVDWLGVSPAFALSRRLPLSLNSLLAPALGGNPLPSATRIAWAVDAPLAFPSALRDLVCGQGPVLQQVPDSELDNPYAYRASERWLARQYGRKPMSATFDRLGNVATLAMSLLPVWQAAGYRLLPQQQADADLAVLETWPALMKPARQQAAIAPFAQLLPAEVVPGSDRYDAALCALVALASASQDTCPLLPPLVKPVDSVPASEGWIYHFQPSHLLDIR